MPDNSVSTLRAALRAGDHASGMAGYELVQQALREACTHSTVAGIIHEIDRLNSELSVEKAMRAVEQSRREAAEKAVDLLHTQLREQGRFWLSRVREAFVGNVRAVEAMNVDVARLQPTLEALQAGQITVGRARELVRCWLLGTGECGA
jgi:hypothetical protein